MDYIFKKELSNNMKFNHEHILLVDDDILNIQVLQVILEDQGLIVDIATSGLEAIKVFKHSTIFYYAAILMDINMCDMNGYDVTQVIRKQNREDSQDIAIYAVTADITTEYSRNFEDAGMNGYVLKPIVFNELFDLLHSIICK